MMRELRLHLSPHVLRGCAGYLKRHALEEDGSGKGPHLQEFRFHVQLMGAQPFLRVC
jgi:hypothetical protein